MNLISYVLLISATWLSFSSSVEAEVEQRSMTLGNGAKLHYSVVTPSNYDGSEPFPAIMAFPHGSQKTAEVEWGIRHYWGPEAEKRGYIVFSPQATGKELFYEGGEKIIPEFIARIRILYNLEGETFHAVGISNGGMSALRVVAAYPEYFSSVLALSGYFWAPSPQKYAAIANKCIVLIAGKTDFQWAEGARRDHKKLAAIGKNAYLKLLPRSAVSSGRYADDASGELFDMIESGAGC